MKPSRKHLLTIICIAFRVLYVLWYYSDIHLLNCSHFPSYCPFMKCCMKIAMLQLYETNHVQSFHVKHLKYILCTVTLSSTKLYGLRKPLIIELFCAAIFCYCRQTNQNHMLPIQEIYTATINQPCFLVRSAIRLEPDGRQIRFKEPTQLQGPAEDIEIFQPNGIACSKPLFLSMKK